MAVTTTVSNHFKYQLGAKKVDLLNDTFKCALMSGEYAFDKDTDATYSDISGGEINGGGGYTTGGNTLTVSSYTEDDSNDKAMVSFNDVTFTGSGTSGFSGEIGSAIVYDSSTDDDTVLGFINFGQNYTVDSAQDFKIKTIRLNVY